MKERTQSFFTYLAIAAAIYAMLWLVWLATTSCKASATSATTSASPPGIRRRDLNTLVIGTS